MTRLKLPCSAIAMLVTSCGGNVEQLSSTSTGGASWTITTPAGPTATVDAGPAPGLVLLTPDQWSQINDSPCAGYTVLAASLMDAGDASAANTDSCRFAVPTAQNGQIIDPNIINLVYSTGSNASQRYLIAPGNPDCALGDGWYLRDNDTIELCAKTCATIEQDKSAMVDVRAGCVGIIIID